MSVICLAMSAKMESISAVSGRFGGGLSVSVFVWAPGGGPVSMSAGTEVPGAGPRCFRLGVFGWDGLGSFSVSSSPWCGSSCSVSCFCLSVLFRFLSLLCVCVVGVGGAGEESHSERKVNVYGLCLFVASVWASGSVCRLSACGSSCSVSCEAGVEEDSSGLVSSPYVSSLSHSGSTVNIGGLCVFGVSVWASWSVRRS